jgi:hypothetical protein
MARRRFPTHARDATRTAKEINMAKAKAKKAGGYGGGGNQMPKEMFLVASKVRGTLKEMGCNTAGDALDGLNNYVGWLVMQATKRASSNGRKTVRAHDFLIF